MSVFLMGTYNQFTKQWCTVAKCGNGHDDRTLEKINKELQVVKISKVRLNGFFQGKQLLNAVIKWWFYLLSMKL